MQLVHILSIVTALIIVVICYLARPLIKQEYRNLKKRSQQVSENKKEIVCIRERLRDAVKQRNDWIAQVNALRQRLPAKKLTTKQKNERELLRRQGLRYISNEADLRSSLQDNHGDQHQLVFLSELKQLADDLSDQHRYTWLKDFYKRESIE